jgi:excisionase family DNA binding protein
MNTEDLTSAQPGIVDLIHAEVDPALFERLIDSKEAGEALGLHPKTIERMAREGRIPSKRIGKYWRFRATDLDRWFTGTLVSWNANPSAS